MFIKKFTLLVTAAIIEASRLILMDLIALGLLESIVLTEYMYRNINISMLYFIFNISHVFHGGLLPCPIDEWSRLDLQSIVQPEEYQKVETVQHILILTYQINLIRM